MIEVPKYSFARGVPAKRFSTAVSGERTAVRIDMGMETVEEEVQRPEHMLQELIHRALYTITVLQN